MNIVLKDHKEETFEYDPKKCQFSSSKDERNRKQARTEYAGELNQS